jgi:hypothetical protein
MIIQRSVFIRSIGLSITEVISDCFVDYKIGDSTFSIWYILSCWKNNFREKWEVLHSLSSYDNEILLFSHLSWWYSKLTSGLSELCGNTVPLKKATYFIYQFIMYNWMGGVMKFCWNLWEKSGHNYFVLYFYTFI